MAVVGGGDARACQLPHSLAVPWPAFLPQLCFHAQRAHPLTHRRMQSDLRPSAWPVEEPSKDQSGKSAGFMLVTGFCSTLVLLRISLNTAPCRGKGGGRKDKRARVGVRERERDPAGGDEVMAAGV